MKKLIARLRCVNAHKATLVLSIVGFCGSLGFYYSVLRGLRSDREANGLAVRQTYLLYRTELKQHQLTIDSLKTELANCHQQTGSADSSCTSHYAVNPDSSRTSELESNNEHLTPMQWQN